ncbi:hypothetical protein BMF94_5002 [Rhodotorula taiwanensis]|uniref:Glutathione transferase n=1 Tax=Rhodotorula taiwanensis TaxID=741276 RepID=A0A2S5B5D8_9BASI|nr:hypothetical protein BMF94_5002 [Rhodotorula taiwanensis]
MPDHIDPPHATGPASETVKAHSEPNSLVFHAGWFCPFVQRVWLALEEKGIPYEYKEVNPYKKEAHFLKINPEGLVPALEHENKALYESLVLLKYLDDAFPEKQLKPTDPHEAGLVRLALQQISNVVVPAFYRYKEEGAAFVKSLQDLHTDWFRSGATWARGDTIGWVDLALAPWVVRFDLLKKHRDFKVEDVGTEFQAWAERIVDRPSVKATTSLPDDYEKVYRRYFEDTAESEVAKATRKGEWLK